MANEFFPGDDYLKDRLRRDELTKSDRELLMWVWSAAADGRPTKEIAKGIRRAHRDELLCAMRQQFFADLSTSGAAKKIAEFLKSYAARAGRLNRPQATPPEAGTIDRAGVELIRLAPPPSWRTVYDALQRYPLSVASESAAQGTT